jgi:hypothetical protein
MFISRVVHHVLIGVHSVGVPVTHIICPTAPVRPSLSSGNSPAVTSTGPSNTNTPEPDHSGGLSTGAKVGTGVGAAIGGALIISALVAFFLRRRARIMKNRSNSDAFVTEMGPISINKPAGTSVSERERAGTPDGVASVLEERATSVREMT